jgi:hypothetical protein
MKANGENKCSGHGRTWDGNFALYKPIVFMSKNRRKIGLPSQWNYNGLQIYDFSFSLLNLYFY